MKITLPWPPRSLSPNARCHWAARAKAAAKARQDARLMTQASGARQPGWAAARLVVALHPPRRPGRMNIDNAIAALKASLDGIADALGMDDSLFRIEWPTTFGEVRKGGEVVFEIEAAG